MSIYSENYYVTDEELAEVVEFFNDNGIGGGVKETREEDPNAIYGTPTPPEGKRMMLIDCNNGCVGSNAGVDLAEIRKMEPPPDGENMPEEVCVQRLKDMHKAPAA